MSGEDFEDEDFRITEAQNSTAGASSKKIELARERIVKDEFDTDAWMTLIAEVSQKPITTARPTYEEFLQLFPTAGRYWKIYIEHELRANNFDQVEKLFTRCLKQCPHVDLWRTYLKYVTDYKSKLPNSFEEIIKAFELAITQVGLDIASTPIWTDYINFVKSQKPNNKIEESQKMEQLRKLYQRAVINPMNNLEGIWKEYDTFENSLNKVLAKALLAEHGPKYMQARATFRERKNYSEGIQKNILARPPRNSPRDQMQVKLWKKLIAYEKRNTQRVDEASLRRRVTFVYNQCLCCLYRYPEMWHEAAHYQITKSGGIEDVVKVYEQGLKACDQSLLLQFSYADFLESHDNFSGAQAVYENLMQRKQDSLIYIEYMRFARRSLTVTDARKIFFRARKSPSCTWHVYVAAAQIELYLNKEQNIARKIYELGLKKFINHTRFLLEYVNFLMNLGDNVNTRALFEKVLSTIPSSEAPEIWNAFQKFETLFGNLETVTNLEHRRSDAYPDTDPNGIFALVQRYRFMDLWPCTPAELASFQGGERVPKIDEEKKESSGKSFGFDQEPSIKLQREKFVFPDLSKLVRYKVEMGLPSNEQIQLPPAISQLLNTLPTGLWEGPKIEPEAIMKLIIENQAQVPTSGISNFYTSGESEVGQKRKIDEISSDESTNKPPATDIYRDRQADRKSVV